MKQFNRSLRFLNFFRISITEGQKIKSLHVFYVLMSYFMLLFSAHKNGEENQDLWCVFLQILPNIPFISTPWSEVHVYFLLPDYFSYLTILLVY